MSTKKLLSNLLGITCFAISSCSGIENNSFFPPIEEQITKSTNNSYSNPTYPLLFNEKKPTYTADPFVIRGDDGYFYMYCTQTENPHLVLSYIPLCMPELHQDKFYHGSVSTISEKRL